jgi:hypothetical protein
MPNKIPVDKKQIFIVSFHTGKEEVLHTMVEKAFIPHEKVKVFGMNPRTDKHFIETFKAHSPKVVLIDGGLHRNSILQLVEKMRSVTNGSNYHPHIFAFSEKPHPVIPTVETLSNFSRVSEIISASTIPHQKKLASLH